MQTIQAYSFDTKTKEYKGKVMVDKRDDGSVILPPNCTLIPPMEYTSHVNIPVFESNEWTLKEDNRKYLDSTGTPTGGTPYWLPSEGDNYYSEPRYMKELGPLPEGAVTERPAKTAEELQKEQLEEAIRTSQETLDSTDYRVIKFMDKYIQTHPEALAEFEAEYPDTLTARQEARDIINGAQATARLANISLR